MLVRTFRGCNRRTAGGAQADLHKAACALKIKFVSKLNLVLEYLVIKEKERISKFSVKCGTEL